MAITLLPTPPSRQDPANFNVRADEFLGALPTFGTEANSLATDVNSKQVTASNAATTATTAATTATTKAGEALSSANEAATSASNANTAKLAAEAALDSFGDRYLGDKSADPTTDNDGGALLVGALYFRTSAPIGMKVWTGTAWDDAYANLSSKFDKTGGDVDGNINFTGAGRLIQADLSSATRAKVKTNVLNGVTRLTCTPNGTANTTTVDLFDKDDIENGAYTRQFMYGGVYGGLAVGQTGSGGYLPMGFEVGGALRLRIDPTTGNVLATSGALGYGTGAGGTVVQATSKSTAVTLNKICGQITMHNASLAAGATVRFILNNTHISASDEIAVWIIDPVGNPIAHTVWVDGVDSGVVAICLKNIGAAALPAAVKIGFAVRKVATS